MCVWKGSREGSWMRRIVRFPFPLLSLILEPWLGGKFQAFLDLLILLVLSFPFQWYSISEKLPTLSLIRTGMYGICFWS